MASWGNTDDAANSVFYAPNQFNKTANTTNQTNLFGNTTTDAFVTGAKIGQFGVKPDEAQAARAGANTKMAHAGWNLRIEGTGGRAGRVQYETLVAMSSITNDASDDAVLPDYKLSITTQPTPQTANATANETATFVVVAASVPTGASLTYAWSYANGDSIAVGETSNTTTSSLVINANTAVDATEYKVVVGATGAASVTSSNVAITVTT